MFEAFLYWHWIVLGLALLTLEMLAPGAIFLWFGVGAVVVGGILYLFPGISWEWQMVIFALFSLASIFIWKKWRKDSPEDDTESGTLNQRGKALIGRKVALVEAIENGVGRVQIDDTFWRVEGDDLAEGQLVKVTASDGASLKVIAA
jgi:inner membrane protein